MAAVALKYPGHVELKAEDFLHFVETDEFRDDWEELGLDVEWDLWALQVGLMIDPLQGAVIPGTGGLRKTRVSPASWGRGKRGAIRVCYAYFPDHWHLLLVMAYDKHARDNLNQAARKAIKEYLSRVEKWLALRNY